MILCTQPITCSRLFNNGRAINVVCVDRYEYLLIIVEPLQYVSLYERKKSDRARFYSSSDKIYDLHIIFLFSPDRKSRTYGRDLVLRENRVVHAVKLDTATVSYNHFSIGIKKKKPATILYANGKLLFAQVLHLLRSDYELNFVLFYYTLLFLPFCSC